nr:thioredoxin domain-containing protein [uncultured Merdimonas sp.]
MRHLTTDSFDQVIRDSSLPVVVMFYASWCSKCAMMKPVAEDLEAEFLDQILFCEVDVDESDILAGEYAGEVVPAFVCFQDGTCLGSMSGIIGETLLKQRLQKIFRKT